MSELLKAFDSYNDFKRDSYFTLIYDTLGSYLTLEVPLEATKVNMNRVVELMNLSENNYELLYKVWNTEDSSNADFDKDFPFEYLLKSLNKKSLIWISLDEDTLSVSFLYDCKDVKLENWVIEMNDKLRKEFGLSRSPVFNVLTKSHGRFSTEEVRTENVILDLDQNYNDDFIKVFEKVENSILSKGSGLILLHGKPGTGKTTYIRSLISQHQDSNFIFIQNEFVNSLLDPEFISFLLKQRNSILVIEDAEKVIRSRESLNEGSIVSTILQLTDGLFSDYLNIKVVCTFNTSLSKIDSALLRKGRMIAMYEFKPLNLLKTNKLLKSLGTLESDEELTLAEIYNIEQPDFSNIEKNKIGF